MWLPVFVAQVVLLCHLTEGYSDDYDLTSEIFGQQEVDPYNAQQSQELEPCPDHLVACAHCKATYEFWLEYPTAYECFKACTDVVLTIESTATGENICQIGLPTVIPSQKDADILGWTETADGKVAGMVQLRQPQYDPLDVVGGVWLGEHEILDSEMFPTGWGQLTYDSTDHLNRDKYIGQMSSGTFNGHGTLLWKDGSRYSGEFSLNQKKGLGTLFYSNGDVFVGLWEQDKKATNGYYQYSTGSFYNGSFGEAGVQEGEGVFQWTEGDLFKGTYKEGHMSEGEVAFTNEDSYQGGFDTKLGQYKGEGKYVWQCGKVFDGNFEDGLPEDGLLQNIEEEWSYEGEFEGGKFHGVGRFNRSGSSFVGFFLEGQMTGRGNYLLSNGDKFEADIPESSEEEDDNWVFKPQPGKFSVSDGSNSYFATFDGKTIRYKIPKARSQNIKVKGVKKGGYKK